MRFCDFGGDRAPEVSARPVVHLETFSVMLVWRSEEQARELASFWEHPPEEVGEDPGVVLMHGSYLALWLLGGETAERVDADYLRDLSTEDRAAFEAEAEQLRGWLRNEGKLCVDSNAAEQPGRGSARSASSGEPLAAGRQTGVVI